MDEQGNGTEKAREAEEPAGEANHSGNGTRGEDRLETLRKAYAQTGILYRHIGGWRGRLFTGYLFSTATVLVAFGWAWTHAALKPLAWVVMGAGCLLTLVFWGLERSNRQVSFSCIRAGSELEKGLDIGSDEGIYTRLTRLPDAEPTPGRTLDWMYLVAALAFLIGTVYALTETM